MLEALSGRRGHADHQQVQPAISIKIRQGRRHAEAVRLSDPAARHVDEMDVPIVMVKIDSRKIADGCQVELAIAIEIGQRRAVDSTPSFRSKAGFFGDVPELTFSVIQQQMSGKTVIGIVVVRLNGLPKRGNSVLRDKHIQSAVAVHIAAGEDNRAF